MLSSECPMSGSKKSRLIKEQGARRFLDALKLFKYMPLGAIYNLVN